MNAINITYYKQLDDVQFTADDIASSYCDLQFNITDRESVGHEKTAGDLDHRIDLSEFSVLITESTNKFPAIIFPREGQVVKSTDQFLLFSERIFFSPDDELTLNVKIGELQKQFAFTVPRPEQPYPSWTWSNGKWNAPVSYPEGEGLYDWNEDNLNWELI